MSISVNFEQHNVSVPGRKSSTYTAQLNALRPDTKYQLRVRCSAADHFWRWSDWSRGVEQTTSEARKFISLLMIKCWTWEDMYLKISLLKKT